MVGGTLVFVAGASPQIITETAHALACARAVPETDVFVLTTTTGRELIRRDLLGKNGAWAALCREYPLARRFRLSEKSVEVLRTADGEELEDVRSERDNAAAADQICAFVAARTRDGMPPVHASIAGGRKTMGYLLAAAMMLYGRREDRLSHVLVRPAVLENSSFFFPPRRGRTCRFTRSDGTLISVPRRDIRLDLAELPFPRLRAAGAGEETRRLTFSALVNELQERLDLLASPRLKVDAGSGRIQCGDRTVALPAARAAVYTLLAERRRKAVCPYNECHGCEVCFLPAAEIEDGFRHELRRRMRELKSHAVAPRWSRKDFAAYVTKINKALRRALGTASGPYEIRRAGSGDRRLYGIDLPREAIELV